MNGYVESGYIIVLATLAIYGTSLGLRERRATKRLESAGQPLTKSVDHELGSVSSIPEQDSDEQGYS